MKIIFVVSRFPYPLEKGDKLRAYHFIKNLSKDNKVVVFALSDRRIKPDELEKIKQISYRTEVAYLSKYSIIVNLIKSIFGKLPLQVAYFISSKAMGQFTELVKEEKPDHVICQLVRTSEYARNINREYKTLDYMDAFSKGVERRMKKAPFYLRPLYYYEYKKLKAYERTVFDLFKNKVIISNQDRNYINHPLRDKITVITNGIDMDYFKPKKEQGAEIRIKKDYDILFSGNMNYLPNIEGAEYLVEKVLPLVRKVHPDVRTLIAGANPNTRIKKLAQRHVSVIGWVDDVKENFARSSILVAPMFLSIGLQNKLMEAMAMQIPCITSTLANNALGACNGESILIADNPEEFANRINLLLENGVRAREIGMNGYNFVLENHNWQKTTKLLEKLISPV